MRTLIFKRQPKIPLVRWSDKLARLTVLSRGESSIHSPHYLAKVVQWIVVSGEDTRAINAIDIVSELSMELQNSGKLISTKFGYVCPLCKTNEWLSSQIDFLPITLKERARKYISRAGEYCQKCGTIS